MLDAGLILYFGFLALFVWRCLTGWHLCGAWLEYANYCALLYALVAVLLVYAVVVLIQTAVSSNGKATWDEMPIWIRPMVLVAPAAACILFAACAFQTWQHVAKIRAGEAALRHDRAVQIIALPAIYGTMALNSMMRMYQFETQNYQADIDAEVTESMNMTAKEQYALAKGETCFWVGDLYEAWALYQFGQLSLDLIRTAITKKSQEESEKPELVEALLGAHRAIEQVAGVGILLFLVVCLVQAGWSSYLLTFQHPMDWFQYNSRMEQFHAAGMVASAAAIYNVHVIESAFHEYLEAYRPLLKFITVKIIVSFAFFQKGILWVLQAFQSTLPSTMQTIVEKVPLVGQILNFSEPEFELFYGSLMVYECVAIALMHWCAWRSDETWYVRTEKMDESQNWSLQEEAGERMPLVPKEADGSPSK